MELSKQVVSLELAQKLKGLGVKQESLFYWGKCSKNHGSELCEEYTLYYEQNVGETEFTSAFTSSELGEMLPREFKKREIIWELRSRKNAIGWEVGYAQWPRPVDERLNVSWIELMCAPTEADARAKMLVYLLENNLLTL